MNDINTSLYNIEIEKFIQDIMSAKTRCESNYLTGYIDGLRQAQKIVDTVDKKYK